MSLPTSRMRSPNEVLHFSRKHTMLHAASSCSCGRSGSSSCVSISTTGAAVGTRAAHTGGGLDSGLA
eukprot:CAMPEP_0179271478 /NCGR_PEP_ID=MMETSP0797-20121207/32004_1 /TAXON_ID=47934 /ORGANISM="Dinophysis acuminata, Strain DAEP01" /LENGTH=66 /DNA_ID=CAMNT_0020979847 /DNA_START=650 /DNA_END=847 /DNA_ORIENTATION=-